MPLGGRVCYSFPKLRGDPVSEEGAAPKPSNSGGGNVTNQAGVFRWDVYHFPNHYLLCLKQNANYAKHLLPVLPPGHPFHLTRQLTLGAGLQRPEDQSPRTGQGSKAHPLLACALCLCAAYYHPSAGYLGANPKASPSSRGQTTVTNR